MTNALTDTRVNLSELPAEGQKYSYTQASGELAEALKDLIGTNDHTVKLTILPMGDCFQLQGSVEAQYNLICPRCAIDFTKPHKIEINELLMVDSTDEYRNGSQSRHNIMSDKPNEMFCHMIDSIDFNIADFVHEIIAINEPNDAKAKKDCDENCENLKIAIKKGWVQLSTEAEGEFKDSHKPFGSLKEVKLNS